LTGLEVISRPVATGTMSQEERMSRKFAFVAPAILTVLSAGILAAQQPAQQPVKKSAKPAASATTAAPATADSTKPHKKMTAHKKHWTGKKKKMAADTAKPAGK
jgi:hypothetical protein